MNILIKHEHFNYIHGKEVFFKQFLKKWTKDSYLSYSDITLTLHADKKFITELSKWFQLQMHTIFYRMYF